jgi:hypothetical protein
MAMLPMTQRSEDQVLPLHTDTSKRVMSNTAQSCELILQKLRDAKVRAEGGLGASAEEGTPLAQAYQLLNTMRAQSVNGFHMCRSVLLRSHVSTGEYCATLESFALGDLVEHLGLTRNPRITLELIASATICTDKLLLETHATTTTSNAPRPCVGRLRHATV